MQEINMLPEYRWLFPRDTYIPHWQNAGCYYVETVVCKEAEQRSWTKQSLRKKRSIATASGKAEAVASATASLANGLYSGFFDSE